MTHIGLDKHFVEQSSDAQLANSSILNDNNSEQIDESNCNNNQEITTKEEEQDLTMPAHPSQASHPSLTNQVDVRSNNELQSKKDDYEEDSKDNHRANYDAYNSPTDEANRSRENVFWQRFDELEGQSTDKTVKGEQLKSSLVSSNKLFVGDAELMIEHMLRTRKIEKIYFDTYRRAKLNDYDANQKTAVLNDVAQNNEKDNKSIDSVAQSAMSDTILQEDKQLVRSVDLSVSESDIKSTSLTNNTTYQKTQLYNQQSVPTNDDQYYQHNLHKNERRLKSKENMIISICSRCNEEGYPNYYTHESYRFTECIHENREHKIEKVCSTGMICGSLNDLFTEDFWNKSEQRDSIRDRGQERRKKYWSSKGIFFDTGRKQDKGKI